MYKAYAIAMSRKIKFQQVRNRGKRSQTAIFAGSSHFPSCPQTVLCHIRIENNATVSLSKSLVLRSKVVGGESQAVKPPNLTRKL